MPVASLACWSQVLQSVRVSMLGTCVGRGELATVCGAIFASPAHACRSGSCMCLSMHVTAGPLLTLKPCLQSRQRSPCLKCASRQAAIVGCARQQQELAQHGATPNVQSVKACASSG